MTTLAELAAELLPGASPAPAGPTPSGRTAAASRSIAWVRVMRPRVPAFDGLDPGDLVIIPAQALAVLAPGAAELQQLVAGLVAAPISGAVVIDAEDAVAARGEPAGATDQAAELLAALAGAGIPGLRVARTDPAALERASVGFIVARGAELERQASLLEAELRRRALEGGGVPGLVAIVSSFLGRAIALVGPRGERLALHAPAEVPGAAPEAAAFAAGARAAGEADGATARISMRVGLPVAGGGEAGLVVLGATPPSELARVTLPRVAGLLALELAREAEVRGAADRARRAEPMPSAGPPWVAIVTRQREPGTEDDSAAAREAREAVRRSIRLVAPARRMSLRGDADSLEVRALAAGDEADVVGIATGIRRLTGRPVAVSRPFTSPADRPAAEAEARATLEAALGVTPPPALARAERLPIYRMLGALHNLPEGPRLARAVLEPLLDARPDVRRERLETLRAVLAHGEVGQAALALGVHRNTIAYRLRGIEAATGWRLADPDIRLALALALELVQED